MLLQFVTETLTHFPGCFAACVLSHWAFRKLDEWKDKNKGGGHAC